jgi:outer membrane protein W
MKTVVFLLAVFLGTPIFAQGFDATLLAGFNAAQIDGDDLAGFNKFGLHGGVKVGYLIKPKLHLSTELLLSQRGSRSSLSLGSPREITSISLSYFELPVIVSFLDWYVDNAYHKVKADVGLSYAYLFQASANNSFFENDVGLFASNDLSFLVGIGYRFNKKIGVNLRYTRSITPLFDDPDVLIRGLFGYFVTFRLEYYL